MKRGFGGTDISGFTTAYPGRTILCVISWVQLRVHDLVLYRASCPIDPGYFRDIRRRGCHWLSGSDTRVG
jgi:hypothetical protein